MSTLKEYYAKDFPYLKLSTEHKAIFINGVEKSYTVQLHYDFNSNAKFVSLYISGGIPPREIISHYLKDINEALKIGNSVEVTSSFSRTEENIKSVELIFTNCIYAYIEENLSETERHNLDVLAKSKNLKLIIRNKKYMQERNRYEKPEAFISHDSNDKKDVAERIAVGLQKLMCPVWYDEYSLKVGDSLRDSIEKGIKEAKKCIIIISPNFLINEGWTKAEFDSIYTREIIEKNNVMLPVWHNVTKEQVYQYSPRLADKVAVKTNEEMDEIVKKLYRAINVKT